MEFSEALRANDLARGLHYLIQQMSNKARRSVADSSVIATGKQVHRSRVTNGTVLLANVDGRSTWARRMRDLMDLHISDLGGDAAVSAAERSIVRRVATLTVELERMEERFATEGEADADALDLYSRTSGNLRRLLEAVGLRRRPRDVTPDLAAYIDARPAA